MGLLSWTLFRINTINKEFIYYESETGRPYIFETIQTGESIPVREKRLKDHFEPGLPERFRQFARMDGNYLWPYVRTVDRKYAIVHADVALLLEHFPTWEYIRNSEQFDELNKNGWNENKHNLFKECLAWSKGQGGFWGEWPY